MKESRFNRTAKNKKVLAPAVIGVVLLMFLIRILLVQTGKLNEITELSPEQMQAYISGIDVVLQDTGKDEPVGRGTVLNSYKNSIKDKMFSCYIVTTDVLSGNYPVETAAADTAMRVILSDGTSAEGVSVSAKEGSGIGIVRVMREEEGSEAPFSKDYFANIKEGNPLYFLDRGGALKSAVFEGFEKDLSCSDTDGILLGAGLYDAHGAYFGMITGISGDKITWIPGDEVIDSADGRK
jgi:hypothetical protein